MAERDPRQECGCPPWVRCVHFEEQVLWLHDNEHEALDKALVGFHHSYGEEERFGVGLGGAVRSCLCSKQHLILDIPGDSFQSFPALPEAQAAFDRRAELLRLGEFEVARRA